MTSANPKLDMKHGFMKSIIRNQFDRDNYDKEIKAKTGGQGRGHRHSHHRKPDAKTYVPPCRLQNAQDKPKNESQEREVLFMMEFEDHDGKFYRRRIFKTDSANDIARRFGRERHLAPAYISALAQRISEEMEKRLGSGSSSEA